MKFSLHFRAPNDTRAPDWTGKILLNNLKSDDNKFHVYMQVFSKKKRNNKPKLLKMKGNT